MPQITCRPVAMRFTFRQISAYLFRESVRKLRSLGEGPQPRDMAVSGRNLKGDQLLNPFGTTTQPDWASRPHGLEFTG